MNLPNINDLLLIFNNFLELSFFYLKYVFAGTLFMLGILTIWSLRGPYFLERLRYSKEEKLEDSPMTKPRLIFGTLYIVSGFGILFNWLIYFLIFLLDPLPDRYLLTIGEFTGLDPFFLNQVSNIQLAELEYEKTIYYLIAMGSFFGLITIIHSLRLLIMGKKKDSRHGIMILIGGVMVCIFFGFTTSLPLLL